VLPVTDPISGIVIASPTEAQKRSCRSSLATVGAGLRDGINNDALLSAPRPKKEPNIDQPAAATCGEVARRPTVASKSRGDRRAHSITDPLPNGADRGCSSADRRVRRHPGDRICVQHRNRDRVRCRDGNCNRDCDGAGGFVADHWRGITQIGIGAAAAAGVCIAATAGICAGGLWKMANSVADLRSGTRLGTYDYDLNWIAP